MRGIINGIFNYACCYYFSFKQVRSQRLIVYRMTKERHLIHLRLVPFSTDILDWELHLTLQIRCISFFMSLTIIHNSFSFYERFSLSVNIISCFFNFASIWVCVSVPIIFAFCLERGAGPWKEFIMEYLVILIILILVLHKFYNKD